MVLLFFSIIMVLVFKLAGNLMFSGDMGLDFKGPSNNPFEQYRTSLQPATGGGETYYFKLENLNGSLSASTAGNSTGYYYSMDIVLATKNHKDALALQKNSTQVANAIRDTVSSFRREDTINGKGREFLKTRIKNRVAEVLKLEDIDAVYFEKLLYQEADY